MKAFVKVSQTYSPKNKLHKIIITYLESINQHLFHSRQEALDALQIKYDVAVNKYKGCAKIPDITIYKIDKSKTGFAIEDVIIFEIYLVLNS